MSPHDAFELMHQEVQRGWWDGALLSEFEALLAATPV
jgi:hypothetical protein